MVAATLMASAAAEAIARVADGYAVASLPLVAVRSPISQVSDHAKWLDPQQARVYAADVRLADGVDAGWFALNPETPPPTPVDPDLNRRYWRAHGHELPAVYEWNQHFISAVLCNGDDSSHPYLAGELQALDDMYVFTSKGGSLFPTYRFLRNAHYPSGLRTNSFGWRGPDIPFNKPPGRIRIAFVGASTTVDAHGDPFSYPEYIGRWLREWAATRHPSVSFDIANAGREGILSNSIAAVVRDELLPVRPDLVVYYEGTNQFWPADFTPRPVVRALRALAPAVTLTRYSALAVRWRERLERPGTGQEPHKPAIAVAWPTDLDEFDPPLTDPRLPVQLPTILKDLDRIRHDLAAVDATLMPSSFVWLVEPDLAMKPDRDALILRELNDRYWPFSYAHIRRFVDFENRVFRKYARTYALPFNDLDAEYPRDPRLFVDTVHMTPAGVKLKAWIVFQHVVAAIEPQLRAHRLPHATGEPLTTPDWVNTPRHLEAIAALKARCSAR